MKITDVEISDNEVDPEIYPTGSGGGIYHLYGVVEISGGSIENPHAPVPIPISNKSFIGRRVDRHVSRLTRVFRISISATDTAATLLE